MALPPERDRAGRCLAKQNYRSLGQARDMSKSPHILNPSLPARNRTDMSAQQLGSTITGKVASIVEVANRHPPITRMLQGWDRSFSLTVDGEEIGIVSSGGIATVRANAPRNGAVWFGLTGQTLDLLIAGRLSPLTAKLTGRLHSAGSTADILRFAYIFSACLQQRRARPTAFDR